MAVVKVNFGNQELQVISIEHEKERWFLANPFARILEYANAPKAVSTFVSELNQKVYENFQAAHGQITSSIHPQSKFINRAGLFELIQGSKMPKAKEFRNWVNSDLLVKLSDTGKLKIDEGNIQKVNFANHTIDVFTIEYNNEKWHRANPFAETLGYAVPHIAIQRFVSLNNKRDFEQIRSIRFVSTPDLYKNIQPKTKFINIAGIFELINASEMPAAKRFKSWENNNLLPTLCNDGEYSMTKNAPVAIAEGMNAIHVATNDGIEAPWKKDISAFENAIQKKDNKIEELTVSLTEANGALISLSQNLSSALNIINEARKDTELARKDTELARKDSEIARQDVTQLANRVADIAQDVIVKPADPQLRHSLAVCALGNDQYAFIRPQKRSLKRSLDRLSVDEQNIVFHSDYVPNAMNVLNKVKEAIPKKKFTARHNKITLLDDFSRQDLVDVVSSALKQRQLALLNKKIYKKF